MSETLYSTLNFNLEMIHKTKSDFPKTKVLDDYQLLRKRIVKEYRTGNISGSQVLDLMDKLNHYIDIDIWERG